MRAWSQKFSSVIASGHQTHPNAKPMTAETLSAYEKQIKYINSFLYPNGKPAERERFKSKPKREKSLDEPVREACSRNYIDFEMIKDHLTGYLSIFEFTNSSSEGPQSVDRSQSNKYFVFSENNLVSVTQGKFVKGKLEGFGRKIESKGTIAIGFYSTALSGDLRGGKKMKLSSQDNVISRPFGKWVEFD